MTAYFVTATGTDVGKTFVTAGLITVLKTRGRTVSALKPLVSGYSDETKAESDSGRLLTALGEATTTENIARISPWRFAVPLSPDMAAARERRTIDLAALTAFSTRAVEEHTGTLFIEGVGGVMVPLTDTGTTLDWMAELNLPALLVTGSYLGSLSHTLTALDALKHRGLKVAALVVNETEGSTVPLAETAATLARYCKDPIAIIPRYAGATPFGLLADMLAL